MAERPSALERLRRAGVRRSTPKKVSEEPALDSSAPVPDVALDSSDLTTMKEQLEHETASYEAQLQERFRGLELQHEDNMRRQKERLSEEMVQTRDEIDSRSRQRIEQIEQEKSAYEKRLRDKYADMARELEMQHTRDAEHWQRKAEDILEEHQIREKELQRRVEQERREFEAQVLKKAEQLIDEYKDAAAKAAERAADEIRDNRAREMELMHQAELNRIDFEQQVKGEADIKLNDLKIKIRETELALEQSRAEKEAMAFELLKKSEGDKLKYQQELEAKSNETVGHFKDVAMKAVERADQERAGFQARDLDMQKQFEERRLKYEAEADERSQQTMNEYKQRLTDARGDAEDAKALLHSDKLQNAQDFERRKNTYEEDVGHKANALIASYKKAASDAEERLQALRTKTQQEGVETTRRQEQGRLDYEREVNDRAAQIVKEYKDMAENALSKAEQERLALNEREMELQRQADNVVLTREKELTEQFDNFKATFESEMRRRGDDMISEYKEQATKAGQKLDAERQRFTLRQAEVERRAEAIRREATEKAEAQLEAMRETVLQSQQEADRVRAEQGTRVGEVEARVEERCKVLLDEYKLGQRNSDDKLQRREREWEQLEMSLRARVEESKREAQNAADAVISQHKEAAQLAEMRLSDERLAAQSRELEEARKQDLLRQEFERNVMAKSNDLLESAKDEVRAAKLELQKERTAFAERERQLALEHERAQAGMENGAQKRAHEVIAKQQREVKDLIEKARAERMAESAEMQRKAEDLVAQYKKVADEAAAEADKVKESCAHTEMEVQRKYENERISFESQCRAKADELIKEHIQSAQLTKDSAESVRREAQTMLREAQVSAEASRGAFEISVKSKAQEMVDEYKRVAQAASQKAEEASSTLAKREMEMQREAEKAMQIHEMEVQRKANELVETYKNMAVQAREDSEREKSVVQEQVRAAQKDMELERKAFEEEVKRRATQRIAEFEDEAKKARAEREEERSRLKLMEMDMAKELESRQTSFEAEVRKKANEAVDVFKKLSKEAQEKAEAEREARTTRELELTSRFDEMKAEIEAESMRRANDLIDEYKKRAQQAEASREQQLASERSKMEADMADFHRTVDDEMNARETQLRARYNQMQAELDQKAKAMDVLRVKVTADKRSAEEEMNQRFQAKGREVESQARAEVAEAKRLLEVEKSRMEAEVDHKKRDLEQQSAANESAVRERYMMQNKSLEDGLRRQAADEKAALEAEREQMSAEIRATMDKVELEKRRHEDSVREKYQATLKEMEVRFGEERTRLQEAANKAHHDALRDLKAKEAEMELERARFEKDVRERHATLMHQVEEQCKDMVGVKDNELAQERERVITELRRGEERLTRLQTEFEDKTRAKYETQRLDVESSFKTLIADMERKSSRERDQYDAQIKKCKDDELAEQKRRVDEVAAMREKTALAQAECEERVQGEVARRESHEEEMRNRMEQTAVNMRNEHDADKRNHAEAMQERCDKQVTDIEDKVSAQIKEREEKERRAWEKMNDDQSEFLRKAAEEKAKYEAEVRETYETLLAQHNGEMQAEREREQAKLREDAERRSQQELQRIRDIEFKKAEFEEDVRARYEDKRIELERMHEQQYDNLRKSVDAQRDDLEKEYLLKDSQLKTKAVTTEESLRESYEEKMQHQAELNANNMAELSRSNAKERRLRELAGIEMEENLRNKYETLLYNQEEAFRNEMNQYKESLEKERERLEQDHRERLKVAQLSTAAYEEDVRERYSKMMAEAMEQARQVVSEREAKDREEWKKREEELVERQREMESARIEYEDQLRGQFTELLRRAEENAREAQKQFEEKMAEERRVEAEAAMERELTLQKEQLDFEQQVWTKYEDMRKSYEEEMSSRMDELKGNLSAEKERIARQQIEMKAAEKVNMAEFESKVREEYDRKVQEFLEMERKVWEDKERLAQEERDRLDAGGREKMRAVELARIEFEDNVRHKYQDMMQQEQEHWKQLEEERAKRGTETSDRIESDYAEKRMQDDIDKKQFEQKLIAKFDEDKKFIDDEKNAAVRKLEAQHVQLRVDMDKAEMERKAKEKAELFEYEEKLRKQCEEEKRSIEQEMKSEMQRREATMSEAMEKIKAEGREKERQLSMKMLEIEDECREKYDQLLDQEKENIRGEFASQAYQVNLENERRHDVEVRAQAQQLEADKQGFEDECRSKYTSMLDDAETSWKAKMAELSESLESERASKQAMLLQRHAEEEQARALFEQQTHSRFDEQRKTLIDDHDNLVQTLKDNFNSERERHEAARAEAVSQMNVLTAQFEKDQRSLYEDKVLEYQNQITGEREKMEGEFRELKEQERQARLDYERDVRAKYEARQMESERVMAQAIKERDTEEAQLRQDMEKARLDFELQCQERYHNLLKEKEGHADQMVKEREEALEQMAEKRREEDLARDREREEARMRYDTELQGKYEQMRGEILGEADQLRAEMEARDLAARETKEGLEGEVEGLQLKMRKLKHASTMWRLDYQKEAKFKYERMLMDMETRQERDSDQVEREKLQAAEESFAKEMALRSQVKAAEMSAASAHSMAASARNTPVKEVIIQQVASPPEVIIQVDEAANYEAELIKSQRSQELAEASEGTRQLGVLRERIQELWAVLESDAPDKLTFVMEVEASAAFSTAMLDLYQKEVVKLTDQLPLMETVTRREFIKYRLNELKSGSSRGTREDKQKGEFLRELKRLNEQLTKALPAYEKKHGQMFLFKGKQYLEIMQGDQHLEASLSSSSSRRR